MELTFLSIEELAALLRKKKVSPVEVAQDCLRRIERLNPRLNAYLTVTTEFALEQARRAEREITRGRWRGPLHGVPISLKDNIWTRGIRTTAGGKFLADFVPGEDATVARRLARAGALLLGKTNLHEFAYGVTTENPHYGPTRNPWDRERIPGGSSGGSAAALAAGLCHGSVGSDTGGSIRIPAALCGLVGLKPTFGRVSCYGVVPLAPSLDHVGPLARSASDAAILLRVMAGRDPLDATSARQPVPDYLRETSPARAAAGGRPLRRLRLGLPRDYFFERVEEEVTRAVDAAAQSLERLGATMVEISLPHAAASEEPSTQIALAEATHYHRSAGYFPARAGEYGEAVRKRLEAGGEVRATDYLRALEMKALLAADFDAAFAEVDAILAPTIPVAAPRIGEGTIEICGTKETVRSALIRLNRPANLVGLPALSMPCGLTKGGLPIGLQLIGPAFEEGRLLRVARIYEQTAGWSRKRAPDS